MRRSLNRQTGVFLLFATFLLNADIVEARRKTVTVTGFRGPGAARIRSYVLRKLRRDHEVIPIRKYVRTAKRLGVRITGRRNIRRICREAGIDAVIFGRVLRSRGRWWLRLYVKGGRTGRTAKRSVIRLRGPRLNSSSRYDIRATLKKGMRRVRPVSKPEPEPETTPDEPLVQPEDKKDKPKPKPEPDKPLGARPGYMSAVEGGVILDVVGRKFVVGPTSTNPDYHTDGLIPPLGVWFEAYPGAFVTRNKFGANIGLGFYWARSFGVSSHTEGGDESYTSVYQKTDIYLTFRWNVLEKPKSPEIKLDLAIGNLRFMFDAPDDQIKALGVNYWYFKPRLRVRVPIALPRLSFLASLGYVHPFQLGPTSEWWAYGTGKAWGIEIMGGVDVRVYWKLHAQLQGQYTHLGLKYDRTDQTFPGSKATDRYYGLLIGIAVKYF